MNIFKAVFLSLLLVIACRSAFSLPLQQGNSEGAATDSESRQLKVSELNRQLRFDAATKAMQQAWEFDDLARARHWLEQQRPRDGEADLREFSWRYFNRQLHRETAIKHTDHCRCAMLSPDGSQLVSASGEKTFVWDLVTRSAKTELPSAYVDNVMYSDDGRYFVLSARLPMGENGLLLYAVDSLTQLASFPKAAEPHFSPDNRLLAMTIGSEVQVYDLHRREMCVRLKGHTAPIFGLCFSADSLRIATGSVDLSARCWDATTGEELRKLDQHRFYVDDVTFGETSTQLISATRGGPFNMWDVSTGLEIGRFQEPTRCSGSRAEFTRSPDSNLLAVVANYGDGSYVDVWDIKSGKKTRTFESDQAYLHAIFLAESKFLAVVDTLRGRIEVWNVMNWEQVETIKFIPDESHFAWGTNVSASKDGCLLAIPVKNDVLLFDLSKSIAANSDRRIAPTPPEPQDDLEPLFVSGADIISFEGRTQLLTRQELVTHEISLDHAAVASDGKLAVGAMAQRSEVLLWRNLSEQPKVIAIEGITESDSIDSLITMLALSPDGRRLAIGDNRFQVQVFDTLTESKVAELGSIEDLTQCTISNSNILAAVAGVAGKEIQLWNMDSKQKLGTIPWQGGPLTALTFSPDSQLLATAGWMKAELWKVNDQTCVQTISLRSQIANPPKFYRIVAFHPDGKSVFVGKSNTVAQVDIATGVTLMSFSSGYWEDSGWNLRKLELGNQHNHWESAFSEVINVAVSSNGEKVAAQFGNGRIYVWRIADGHGVAVLPSPLIAHDVAFAKGGDDLVVGGRQVQVTNCKTSDWKPSPLPIGKALANSYALSLDGRFAVIEVLEQVDSLRHYQTASRAVIKVIDLKTGLTINQIRLQSGLHGLAISPDSSVLALASSGSGPYSNVSLRNLKTGELLGELPGKPKALAFLSDGSLLSGVFKDHPWTLPPSTLSTWLEKDEITAIAFSPKASAQTLLATATSDGNIQIWDYKSSKELATLVGHNGVVHSMIFSQDGQSLVSGGNDSKVRFWNLTTYQESLALALKKPISKLKLTASENVLAVQLADGTVRLIRGER